MRMAYASHKSLTISYFRAPITFTYMPMSPELYGIEVRGWMTAFEWYSFLMQAETFHFGLPAENRGRRRGAIQYRGINN